MTTAFIHLTANGSALPGRSGYQEFGGISVEDHTKLISFYHEMSSPFDSQGRLAGHTGPGPITFVKAFDALSPLLLQALAENQLIAGQIKFFDLQVTGGYQLSRTLTMTNARITDIRKEMLAGQEETSPVLERVSVFAHSINLESHTDPTTQYTYTWTPVA